MTRYRGIEVTYESIREWCQKFDQQYAHQLRRKRLYVTDKWHLDGMVVTIKKQQYSLWWTSSDTITNAIKAIDAIAQVTADPKTKQVSVETQASETSIKEVVTNAGYTVA